MELRDFRLVRGRNNRRKQAKVGKFDKEKISTSKLPKAKPKYHFPKLSKPELDSLKAEIRAKIKVKNRNNIIFVSIVMVVLILLFYFIYLKLR